MSTAAKIPGLALPKIYFGDLYVIIIIIYIVIVERNVSIERLSMQCLTAKLIVTVKFQSSKTCVMKTQNLILLEKSDMRGDGF